MKTLLVATAMFVALSSFVLMGAHSFAIEVDGRQVAEQYVMPDKQTPRIVLNPAENRELTVKYSECGRTVQSRAITVKDSNDKVVKEWKFEGAAAGFKDVMKVSVKELASLKSSGALKLFYSSNDFPKGQLVANLEIKVAVTAAK